MKNQNPEKKDKKLTRGRILHIISNAIINVSVILGLYLILSVLEVSKLPVHETGIVVLKVKMIIYMILISILMDIFRGHYLNTKKTSKRILYLISMVFLIFIVSLFAFGGLEYLGISLDYVGIPLVPYIIILVINIILGILTKKISDVVK